MHRTPQARDRRHPLHLLLPLVMLLLSVSAAQAQPYLGVGAGNPGVSTGIDNTALGDNALSSNTSSKQLRRLLIEGQSMAHVVRMVVKDHFGPREEKIVEFGLKPFRGRKVKAAAEKPTPPTAAVSAEPVKSEQ